ncbi:hypothetical protein [Nitrosomonas sp. Nm33]|uniref:hypothetical protein n=1 Tax=Nitrosomonas sp. Nm33 TaxID=133724 RepID=UPI00089C9E81|nr:hypothetical protein [Nitrosomonas sp. Nm33]SDZ10770.1 hypothetical protein SAMN05421755_11154 [Nitrosomonas sp. Nm33]
MRTILNVNIEHLLEQMHLPLFIGSGMSRAQIDPSGVHSWPQVGRFRGAGMGVVIRCTIGAPWKRDSIVFILPTPKRLHLVSLAHETKEEFLKRLTAQPKTVSTAD